MTMMIMMMMKMMWLNTMPTFSDWLDRDCYHIWQPQLQRILHSWFWTGNAVWMMTMMTTLCNHHHNHNHHQCQHPSPTKSGVILWQKCICNKKPQGELIMSDGLKLIEQDSPTNYDGPTLRMKRVQRRGRKEFVRLDFMLLVSFLWAAIFQIFPLYPSLFLYWRIAKVWNKLERKETIWEFLFFWK